VADLRGYVSEHLGDPDAVLVLCSADQRITAGAMMMCWWRLGWAWVRLGLVSNSSN